MPLMFVLVEACHSLVSVAFGDLPETWLEFPVHAFAIDHRVITTLPLSSTSVSFQVRPEYPTAEASICYYTCLQGL